MARCLVLGCGSIGHAVVVSLVRRGDHVVVVVPDPDRVETLRNEGVRAERGDPSDPAAVAVDDDVATVLVAGDDPAENLDAAESARSRVPDASLVVYAGVDATAAQRAAIESLADLVVDPGSVVVDRITDVVESSRGTRQYDLLETLRDVPGRLGVFTHDNPDPDAIASAVALRDLARAVGTDADACYFGDISHQENRALVNVLELDMHRLDGTTFDPDDFEGFALVDHSRPGVNDQLPEGLAVDVVVDHHPPRGAIGGRFVDLRDDVGATSTMLVGYYRTLGVDVESTVATALLYGIRVDTRDFGRGITEADFDAAAYLVDRADAEVLGRIESPSATSELFSVLARAISGRVVRGPVLATSAGRTSDRDALAQAADELLGMEGISIVLVLGILEDTETVIASARTRRTSVDVGEALRLAYDQIGSAGGHTDMAGAQIPLGILGQIEDESGSLEEIIGDVLIGRFFEVMEDVGVVEPDGATSPDAADATPVDADLLAGLGSTERPIDEGPTGSGETAPPEGEPGESDQADADGSGPPTDDEENDFSPRDSSP